MKMETADSLSKLEGRGIVFSTIWPAEVLVDLDVFVVSCGLELNEATRAMAHETLTALAADLGCELKMVKTD